MQSNLQRFSTCKFDLHSLADVFLVQTARVHLHWQFCLSRVPLQQKQVKITGLKTGHYNTGGYLRCCLFVFSRGAVQNHASQKANQPYKFEPETVCAEAVHANGERERYDTDKKNGGRSKSLLVIRWLQTVSS